MSRAGQSVRVLLAVAGILLPAAAWAAVDHRQSYLDGLEALERGQYEAAVVALERAVAGRPLEQPRARLVGAIPQPYLPHHYLGVALYRLKRCRRAVEEWSLSAAQGVIDGFPDLDAAAQDGRRNCDLVERAGTALDEPDLGASGDERRLFDSELATRRAAALSALDTVRQRLARGLEVWDFEMLATALGERTEAAEALAAVDREAERLWQRRESERLAEKAVREAPPPAPTRDDEPAPPAAGREGEAPGADRSQKASADPPSRTGQEVLPGEVRAAIEAYFEGDYEAVLARLEPLTEPDGRRAAVLTALFRGAARYALFLRGGEVDRRLFEQAARDLGSCARQAPGFRPDPAHFSPRFLELYRQQRTADPATSEP